MNHTAILTAPLSGKAESGPHAAGHVCCGHHGQGCCRAHDAMPLMLAPCGEWVHIAKLGGGGDTRGFLETLGFVPGGKVRVVCETGGNLIVEVKGARVALSRQMAARVMVGGELAQGGRE